MNRTLFSILLLSPLLLFGGTKEGWDHFETFVLKKDQIQKVAVYEEEKEHTLAFRWTLYQNGGLVMHVAYDSRRFQPLLYAKYRLDSFRIDLFSKPNDASPKEGENPYALLVFKAYDAKRKEAYFDLLIKSYGKSEILYERGK
ncbi:hypothetical protein [Hydrogenimonas cancrithermarum]|uniref:Uncharacterized protein n=1 Tax=Hydrogenimonas cancrithermarum TaxID=2993563 RepID=A0ABM8FIL4_9BACT|nr:hypothetical protein [Hydrogenimonas cancrithermarum]BDY12104.1 hypothetical protein HCR_04160 [Hydrogenimonas cancrithermarum]